MDRAEIASQTKKTIALLLGINKGMFSETSEIVKDLGADSLDVLEMLMAVEEDFSISLEDNEIEAIETVGQAIDLIFTKTR